MIGGERISSTDGEKTPPDDSDSESLNSSASNARFKKDRVVFAFLDVTRSLIPCERPELFILETLTGEEKGGGDSFVPKIQIVLAGCRPFPDSSAHERHTRCT